MLESFFRQERIHGGWRFWVLWVVLTNVGFFAGLIIEYAASRTFAFTFTFTLVLAVPLASVFQGRVLNRHIVALIPWVLATSIGWWVGLLIMMPLLNFFMPAMHPILRTMSMGAGAGLLVGSLQWIVLRNEVKQIGLWWIAVSAVGWAIMAPGVITGIPLAYFVEYDYRDLVYRAWEKPKSAEELPEPTANSIQSS